MMLTQTSSLQSFISTLERQTTQSRQQENILLQGVIESFFDGILILTEQGKLIHSNHLARQICEQLTEGKSENNFLPKEIWRVCQALIESRSLYENQPVIIESEITTEQLTTLRIRTRWLQLSEYQQPCLLVILEDKHKSIQNLALAEVVKYGLTRRETEIWLLRRTNVPLKNIAGKLGISINTVKKHLKNIYAKRENFLYMEEWRN
jgi:DNA-binding CsgD family transcriptional regulator